jgi:Tol biopolymer transport system component
MRSAVARVALSATLALLLVASTSSCAATSGPKSVKSPHASAPLTPIPAGRLVFAHFLDAARTSSALFVSNSDGSHETQLTKPSAKEVDSDPNWAPDGAKIVFARYLDLGTSHEAHQIAIMNSDGSGIVNLTAGTPAADTTIPGFDDSPVFSPDGQHIAFDHANGLVTDDQLEHSAVWVMGTDGSGARQVVALPPYTGDMGGLAWSPDGSRILYGVGISKGTPPTGRTFFSIKADGTDNRQLGSDWTSGEDGVPSWNVATNKIAFRIAPDEETGVGNFFTINPDGSGLSQVTHYSNTVMSHKVDFSPDGRWIVYSTATDGPNHLAIAAIDGSRKIVLFPKDRGSSAPDWGPAP